MRWLQARMLDGASVANINPKGPYKNLVRPLCLAACADLQGQLADTGVPRMSCGMGSCQTSTGRWRSCRRTSEHAGVMLRQLEPSGLQWQLSDSCCMSEFWLLPASAAQHSTASLVPDG